VSGAAWVGGGGGAGAVAAAGVAVVSIFPLSWVLRHSEEKLGRRLVLLVLADHAKEDGSMAWPSVETIAAHARLSRRAVQDALRELEKSGAIRKRGVSQAGTS
jgi:hypothetical protein